MILVWGQQTKHRKKILTGKLFSMKQQPVFAHNRGNHLNNIVNKTVAAEWWMHLETTTLFPTLERTQGKLADELKPDEFILQLMKVRQCRHHKQASSTVFCYSCWGLHMSVMAASRPAQMSRTKGKATRLNQQHVWERGITATAAMLSTSALLIH